MLTDEQLARSKSIQRQTGRTFHIATRFLPESYRHATYVLYAFFRLADEVVDDPDPAPPEIQREILEQFRMEALGERASNEPVLVAFSAVRERHGIADAEVNAFIDAMKRDIDGPASERVAFEDEEDVRGYLRGSAVAVAFMMLDIMDPQNREVARPHARALGEAFQLTNFLRDIREDIVDYGRIYLPRSTLRQTGSAPEDIAALQMTSELREAVRIELERAEQRYRKGVAGIRHLPDDCQLPVLMAAVFYADYHRLIRHADYDVLSEPPELTLPRYISLFLQTRWHWTQYRDPERVFYEVSPVKPESADTDDDSIRVGGPSPVKQLLKGWIDR